MITWDYEIWNVLIQISVLAILLLIGNTIRRKVKFLRNLLLPTAIIGGFLALGLKYIIYAIFGDGVFIQNDVMGAIAYHCIALGFIALTLKETEKLIDKNKQIKSVKSGLLIVSTYALQGLLGMGLTMLMSYTFFPDLFQASGLLLMLGYGQGPGQAGNIGTSFENQGFIGGNAFGLSIASIGIIWACVGGVIYMNILRKRNKLSESIVKNMDYDLTQETYMEPNEIPNSESIDKLSVQFAFILAIYAATYLLMYGINSLIESGTFGDFGLNNIRPLVWGFNFIWATLLTMLLKVIIKGLRKIKIMNRQYTNNYMLNRISGFTFDFMIIAAICAIDIGKLNQQNLWIPLLVLCTVGGFVTLFYVKWSCKKLYSGYQLEGFLSMYGMLTGTISDGMVLLREVDPQFKTPAAGNLIFGSTTAVAFGAPLLLLIGIATVYPLLLLIIMAAVFGIMLFAMLFDFGKLKRKKPF